MKKKDVIALVIAVVILLVAGYLAYTQLLPQKTTGSSSAAGTQVEVVDAIDPGFDAAAMSQLDDPTKVRDFAVPLDLTTGLNNQAVFGQ